MIVVPGSGWCGRVNGLCWISGVSSAVLFVWATQEVALWALILWLSAFLGTVSTSSAVAAFHCLGIWLFWSKCINLGVIYPLWVLYFHPPTEALFGIGFVGWFSCWAMGEEGVGFKYLGNFLISIRVSLIVAFQALVWNNLKQMQGKTLFSSNHMPMVASILDWWYKDCHLVMNMSMSRSPWLNQEISFFVQSTCNWGWNKPLTSFTNMSQLCSWVSPLASFWSLTSMKWLSCGLWRWERMA